MPGSQNSKSTLDFLGTLGSKDRGDLLPASAKALVELAAFLIETATDNLDRKGNTATGETASSMKIVNLDLSAPSMSVEVEILKSYKFLDKGVKGYESGTGKYQFKKPVRGKTGKRGEGRKKMPKMVAAILKWLKKRSLSGKVKYKAVSRNERKDKSINKTVNDAKSREALAYAVATNIKKKGIKPTYFFTNAIKATQKETKKKFAEALKIDIINSLS